MGDGLFIIAIYQQSTAVNPSSSTHLNGIGPKDVVNPAVFAAAQFHLSQGAPDGAQVVQVPSAIPHTTVDAKDLATHHTG